MKSLLINSVLIFSLLTLAFPVPVEAASNVRFKSVSITKRRPCQNTNVTYSGRVVRKDDGTPIKGASVIFRAHYKTTTTKYSAGRTDANGAVEKEFKIGRATPGYKVIVKAVAKKRNGAKAFHTTWFVPVKCAT